MTSRAIAFVVALAALLPACRSGAPALSAGPGVGERAPDFEVVLPAGGRTTLAAIARERPVVLWFTNLCSACRKKAVRYEAIRGRAACEVVAVLAPEIEPGEVAVAREATGATFPMVFDADRAIAGKYGSPVTRDT